MAWTLALASVGIVIALVLVARREPVPTGPAPPTTARAIFSGSASCAGCHAGQAKAWGASKHASAMLHADASSVAGDFSGKTLREAGVTSTFFTRDGSYFVRTDGADGRLADFEVKYAIGVRPLQQYLVAFPDGRLQALPFAWDTRPRSAGGQRWFHLYAGQGIAAGEPLHWTGRYQNWNWMCADCHTTRLERNYDAANDRYATTWSEMNVACESCHGPGSNHVAWARDGARPGGSGLVVQLDERKGAHWLPVAATGNSVRSPARASQRELAVCSQCHSRRAPLAAGLRHDGRFAETHDIERLSEASYFPDGQQREEVYEVGSFLQSRMHANGVSCSDCHEPHSGQLRGDQQTVCAQCHAPARYAASSHTMHAAGSSGSQCVDCHMPSRTYMGIDARRDHSIRIPRPDLDAAADSPDACTGCHRDRDAAWAATAIAGHFGPDRKGLQDFGAAFRAARAGDPAGIGALAELAREPGTPAIVRASALADLSRGWSPVVAAAVAGGLEDPDALVRGSAADALLAAPAADRLRLALPRLTDANRLVRLKAARALAVADPARLGDATQRRLEQGFAAYVAAQLSNSERPESFLNLGLFYAERGRQEEAEASYRRALQLAPDFVPAYIDLADHLRSLEREVESRAVLEEGLRRHPRQPDLAHALGLALVRSGQLSAALPMLAEAAVAQGVPARYPLVYAVALHESGRKQDAIAALQLARRHFPHDAELQSALAAYLAGE